MNKNTPGTNQDSASDTPQGDLDQGDKTWSPADGNQAISSRPDDAADGVPDGPDGDEADDAAAFNGDDDDDEEEDDDEEDDDEEDEPGSVE
jgi:hypothetical protein